LSNAIKEVLKSEDRIFIDYIGNPFAPGGPEGKTVKPTAVPAPAPANGQRKQP
jgi:hypothetical protein